MYAWFFLLYVFIFSFFSAGTNFTQPNILFILQDDVGWANVDWHEPDPRSISTTPNLALMLSQGVELTRHYSYKLCSPSRSALQSGRNPIHCTLHNDDVRLLKHALLNPILQFTFEYGFWFLWYIVLLNCLHAMCFSYLMCISTNQGCCSWRWNGWKYDGNSRSSEWGRLLNILYR